MLIVAMIALIANFAVKTMSSVRQKNYNGDVQWYLFIREMESDAHQFELIKLGDNQLQVYSRVSQKAFVLVCHENQLYLTKVHGGGYLPLMSHVKQYHPSQLNKDQVGIQVTMTDGRICYARLYLPHQTTEDN